MIKQTTLLIIIALSIASSSFAQKNEMSNDEEVRFANIYLEANRERILGNLQQAATLYFEAIEIDPNSAAAYYDLSKIFIENKDVSHAENALIKAVELDGDNHWYKESLAQIYSNREKHKDAAKLYLELSERFPKNSDFAVSYASECVLMGKHKKAIKAFEDIEKRFGVLPELSLRKYQFFIAKNQLDAAATELNKIISLFPEEGQYYGKLADLYKAQGKNKEALQVYERANKAIPNNPYIQLSLYEYYETLGEKKRAFEYMQLAFSNTGLDIDTKVGVLLKMFSKAEKDLAFRAKTIDLCQRVVESHPNSAKAYAVNGDFLALDEQNEKALKSYLKAVKIDPSKYAIWSQVLFIESSINAYDSLVKHSEQAIEYFPTQPASYLFNGLANNQLKRHKKAAVNLELGAMLTVGNRFLSSQMLASLGDAYHELKRYDSSDSAYDASLTYNEDNLYVLNNYAYYLSLRGENLEQAKEMSKKTVDAEPNSASYLDTYGWILYSLGEYEAASEYLKKSLDHGGDQSGEVLEHYADSLFKLNKLAEAHLYYKKAKEIGEASEQIDEKIKSTQQAK
jgi:tetratricopeptide (TPR) repeat protein